MMAKVDIRTDEITISDRIGEVVKWVKDEWEEDPNIVPTIANAVKLTTEGQDMRTILKKWDEVV